MIPKGEEERDDDDDNDDDDDDDDDHDDDDDELCTVIRDSRKSLYIYTLSIGSRVNDVRRWVRMGQETCAQRPGKQKCS
ncbi:hypothetical protein PoB_004981800 [Plakobranchus ocellatus]|uniref:Uncharacterized protein n=1 Tax=Plakobranchus ocellatus TaxID=259542 RepID=A0AAV4BVR6_9GAST|nr:hypothetical protein PoB_004981800 [Plakobranchus ocellatus]